MALSWCIEPPARITREGARKNLSERATSLVFSPGSRRSSALGQYLCCYYLGGSLGASLPGWLWQHGGWGACVFLLLAMQLLTSQLARRL